MRAARFAKKNCVRIAALAMIALVGCLYPPMTQPPSDEQQRVVIPLPYDLAWDAVNSMLQENGMRIQAQDSNHGIIEAVGPRFTLHDADCGKIKGAVGTYAAEPELNSSSVYNFLVRPHGKEASVVEVRATFASAVRVPLRPTKDVDCVSHGIQESNLLRQLLVVAKQTRRPTYAEPSTAPDKTVVDSPPPPPRHSSTTSNGESTIGKSPSASRFSIAPSTPLLRSPGPSTSSP
jgi:hypothetical protein